ncbi:MAG: Asp-tRNA(Asn)/Glu-tRNA(Gln) amidotransferase GatCAB subunit B, partial [Gordonibacter sp.]
DETPLTPERALALVKLTAEDAISSKQAKEVFAAVLDEDKDPSAIVAERGMEQVSDTSAIESVVDAVLAANPDKVEQYRGGKTGLVGFFVGQCMKEMRGQGNPKVINELVAKKLG